ncbi:hypothetical protein MKW94_000633 [Papaver nudicaule]|uniref:SHSP domain-containing protein n=1 Tax=Papaver nudicaule TaxID=74823 RepID=A0AA41W286_PAPNU|nr:hypothetical protein [Papaver nudicaule]
MDNKFQANFTRSYEDFEPVFNWVREEGLDTLVLHLPGFKKEQLRVQVDSHGNMKITGERPLEEKRWSRFRKDFPIPNNCDVNEIHAKYVGGLLYVKFPKKITQVTPQDQTANGEKYADERRPNKDQATSSGNMNTGGRTDGTSGYQNGNGGLAMHKKPVGHGFFGTLNKHRRLFLGVTVVATAMVAIGVYVACRLSSSLGEDGNVN